MWTLHENFKLHINDFTATNFGRVQNSTILISSKYFGSLELHSTRCTTPFESIAYFSLFWCFCADQYSSTHSLHLCAAYDGVRPRDRRFRRVFTAFGRLCAVNIEISLAHSDREFWRRILARANQCRYSTRLCSLVYRGFPGCIGCIVCQHWPLALSEGLGSIRKGELTHYYSRRNCGLRAVDLALIFHMHRVSEWPKFTGCLYNYWWCGARTFPAYILELGERKFKEDVVLICWWTTQNM